MYRSDVHIVIGVIIAMGTLFLAYALITGRARAERCCSVADPMKDLRIANAVREDSSPQA